MVGVSEALAHRLKTLCRLYFGLYFGGLLVWLVRKGTFPAPEELPISLWVSLSAMTLLTVYLSAFLGVDVLGVNRLFGIPAGKPFQGLSLDEEDLLRFDYTDGRIGWFVSGGLFKLRLTNQRLLVGANLTSWYLLEIPLHQITSAEAGIRRWLSIPLGPVLRLTRVGAHRTEQWDIGLRRQFEFEQLVKELRRWGVPVRGMP